MNVIASHAGVFRGARFSSLPTNDEKRAPLKTPAWEAMNVTASVETSGSQLIPLTIESEGSRHVPKLPLIISWCIELPLSRDYDLKTL